jgi:hypothetical protein
MFNNSKRSDTIGVAFVLTELEFMLLSNKILYFKHIFGMNHRYSSREKKLV